MYCSKSNLTLAYLLFASFLTLGQGRQAEYLEAKRLFNTNDLISAESAFRSLETDPVFGAYAGFYRGLTLYRQDQKREAVLIWKKLQSDYPSWDKEIEILYWLSISYMEMGDFEQGLDYLNKYTYQSINAGVANRLIPLYLNDLSVERLSVLQDRFPELHSLAHLLAVKINQLPKSEKDQELLSRLIEEYELSIQSVMELDVSNVKKTVYDVAIVLPFMFGGLDDPTATVRNPLVMDLYQGMQLAVNELSNEGIIIRLHSFDTYKEADSVRQYEEQLSNMDLIIGPLYPAPIEAVKAISSRYKVNMISPLTSNSSYMDGNPYAFLAKASYETMAQKLAEFVSNQNHQKTALIYFSKDVRDSLFAETYRTAITQDSIEVIDFRSVDRLTAKYLLDTLTEQYEHYYEKEEADSIAELEGRFVKTRKLREEEKKDSLLMAYSYYELDDLGNLTNQDDPVRLLSYEEKFKVPKDTVGHILVVSRSMSIYNNFTSAKAARQDSIGIYGYSNWFDNKLVNYELMDQVDATVAVTEFINYNSEPFESFVMKIASEYKKYPTEYHVNGYDMMSYLGKMLDEYGKYFQFGAYEAGTVKGPILQGYDFTGFNDNQVVPILQIEDYFIKTIKE
jgi:ABC-type branched-subunit amino acid transport system substrate-binding protein